MLGIRRTRGNPEVKSASFPRIRVRLTPYIATVMKIDAATALWSPGFDSIPMTEWWFL
jgi:hypothetical protein